MDDAKYIDCTEEAITLLGVRADGVASVVDLMPVESKAVARSRALGLLREHASCSAVEIWCCGTLVDRLERSEASAPRAGTPSGAGACC